MSYSEDGLIEPVFALSVTCSEVMKTKQFLVSGEIHNENMTMNIMLHFC